MFKNFCVFVALVIALTACSDQPQVNKINGNENLVLTAPEEVPENIIEIDGSQFEIDLEEVDLPAFLELKSESSTVLINDFSERQVITSPLELTGLAPRSWFFEGVFPVTLMSLEESIIKEWYAKEPWLEPLEEGADFAGSDPIPFSLNLEFEIPDQDSDLAKLRFAKDLVADTDQEEFVEAMVILGE